MLNDRPYCIVMNFLINWFFVSLYFQLLVKGASERGAKRIRLHILTDGRDVLDGSSVGFVETLENDLAQLREKGVDAQVASGGGRMYAIIDKSSFTTNGHFSNH